MLRKKISSDFDLLPDIAKVIFIDDDKGLNRLLEDGIELNQIKFSSMQVLIFPSLQNMSPLCFAAAIGSIKSVRLLLAKEANPYFLTPCEIAREQGYSDIVELLPMCFGVWPWFKQFLQALNYPFSEKIKEGICLGITNMVRQAFFSNEIDVFNHRLTKMYELFKQIEAETTKELNLDSSMDKNGDYLNNQLGQYIRKKIYLYVHENNERKTDIHAFCDGIVLYQVSQHPDVLDHLFENYANALSNHRSQQLVFNLVQPVSINGKINTDSVGYFTGAYSLEHLEIFFYLLKSSINSCSFSNPISFNLIGLHNLGGLHVVEIGYDNLNERFMYTNSEQLPTRSIHSARELAKAVAGSFMTFNYAIFATIPVSFKQDRDKLHKMMESIWQNQNWQQIHAITLAKSKLRTDHGDSWRTLAVQVGDPITMMEIDSLGGALHQWKRQASGAAVGGLLGLGLFSLAPAVAAGFAVAKIVQFGSDLMEYGMATQRSLVDSSLPQQPIENITNQSMIANYRLKFIDSWVDSWQKKGAPEVKIGTMLQNRRLTM